MTTARRPRTLPIRRWLALALLAVFLAPVLTMGVIGFLLFRETHGPVPVEQRVETRVTEDVGQWADPAWQAEITDWLAGQNVDILLIEGSREVFRSTEDPLGGTDDTSRLARRHVIPNTDPPKVAYIFADQEVGPPTELRQWFVPIALALALLLALGGIAWFLRQSLVDPLTATSGAARRVAAGELDIALPTSRVREVAELNDAFEGMSAELRESLARQAELEDERRMLIGAVVHDLRTPLFSLRGSLEGLATGVADTPEKRARYVAIAQEKAEALERLIADLFAFTRLEYLEETPAPTRIELGPFLAGIVEGMQPRAEPKGVRLKLAAPAEPVTVEADSQMLTRAIENLLDNALRHTPEGGTVQVAWREAGSSVEIAVSDTGPGIPAADLPHVFDPLFRGEASRSRKTGGAGLGLTIARRILLAHNGDLTARNAPDGGAVFTATLPAGNAVNR